jgi:ribosomal protein S18 acetylase RimI-like enzyme
LGGIISIEESDGKRMSILIRKYKDSDISEIISLMPRFTKVPLPRWREAEDISKKTKKIIDETLLNITEETELFVAEEDQKVLGFVLLQTRKDFFTDEKHGYISEIAVKKEAEGRGVGQMLLESAEIWTREKGYRLLVLHMLFGNERAKRVYERFGFTVENVQYVKLMQK